MKRLIDESGPFRLPARPKGSLYESLLRSIVYQQLNGRAAESIYQKFKSLYEAEEFPNENLILKTPLKKLRQAGLSGAKAASILDLSRFVEAKRLPTLRAAASLGADQLIEQLTQVRGIGPWTVQMFLMFRLRRMDIMPAADYGVRSGYALTFGMPDLPHPKVLLDAALAWKPYRSMAAWYLWRAVDLKKKGVSLK